MADYSYREALTARQSPTALAKHAISVLEKRLADAFGVTVLMGAELEFIAQTRSVSEHRDREWLGLVAVNGKERNYRASVSQPSAQKDAWFPQSRRISFSYRELKVNDGWQHGEVVLTHQPADRSGKLLSPSALTLAACIEGTRHQLTHMPLGHKPGRGNLEAEMHHAYWQAQRAQAMKAVRFDACVPEASAQSGLHLNASVVDARGRELFTNGSLAANVAEHIRRLTDDHLYLLASSPMSLQRWRRQFGHEHIATSYVCPVKYSEGDVAYLENRIPGADSNAYYSVLLELAGIYSALEKRYEPLPGEALDYRTVTADTVRQRFGRSSSLRNVLNAVEPGLGDRFYDAVARMPPNIEHNATEVRHRPLGGIGR